MFTARIATAARATVVATAIGAAVFGTAGVAFAAPALSSDDETYLSALDSEGISFPTDEKAVNLAHHICDSFDTGVSFDDVAQEGRDQSELSDYEIGFVIAASVLVYCPQFEGELPA